jgi:hypothetical protein
MLTPVHHARARASAPLALALTLALAAVLGGCGGSSDNGVASKTASEILAASKSAAENASSVHVVSKSSQGPLTLTTNLQLSSNGGRGQISGLGLNFEVIRIGNTLYVKGSPAFQKRLAGTTDLPPGSWLKAPANSGQLAQLAAFTNLPGELGRLLSSANPVTKGATTTINRQKTIELKQTGKIYTGQIYIATTGQPYPIQILKHGHETGQTTLTNWNQPITLTPPANTITISQ